VDDKVQDVPILLTGGSGSPSPPVQRTMTVMTPTWRTVMWRTLPVLLLHRVYPLAE
jgi:hypothetical protein